MHNGLESPHKHAQCQTHSNQCQVNINQCQRQRSINQNKVRVRGGRANEQTREESNLHVLPCATVCTPRLAEEDGSDKHLKFPSSYTWHSPEIALSVDSEDSQSFGATEDLKDPASISNGRSFKVSN